MTAHVEIFEESVEKKRIPLILYLYMIYFITDATLLYGDGTSLITMMYRNQLVTGVGVTKKFPLVNFLKSRLLIAS